MTRFASTLVSIFSLAALAACAGEPPAGDEHAENHDLGNDYSYVIPEEPGVAYGAATGPSDWWRWPSLTVKYSISFDFSTSDAELIEGYLYDAVAGTPLTLEPITFSGTVPPEIVWILPDPDPSVTVSHSAVATNNGGATITLGTDWSSHASYTVQHEFGHAVGLIHELQRSDRSSYVNIDWDCITDGEGKDAFKKITDSVNLTPWDDYSIMNYGSWTTFTKDSCAGQPVATHLDGSTFPGGFVWSPEDRNAVWQMYEPQLGNKETNDYLGWSMVAADFDGDGYEDLAVGVPREGPGSTGTASGAVLLYKGTYATGLVPWKVLWETDFPVVDHSTDEFGHALTAGDMDGDDCAELFVGAPAYQTGGATQAGAVFYYHGDPIEGLVPESDFLTQGGDTGGAELDENSDEFGFALKVLNRTLDGKHYLAVGAPQEVYGGVQSGYVTMFRWYSGKLHYVEGFTGSGVAGGGSPADGDRFGAAFASGDFNGDDLTDLAVGAPGRASSQGAVYVFRGAGTLSVAHMSPMQKLTLSSPAANDEFGYALTAGNFDGDSANKRELAVGAPGRSGAGRVITYVDDTYPDISLSKIETLGANALAGDRYGSSLAHGDINGDGYDDLVVGIPDRDNGSTSNAGQARFLTSTGSSGTMTLVWTVDLTSPGANDYLGTSVAVGDFNDNGYDNAVVGAPGRSSGAGAFYEFHGGTTPDLWRSFDEETWEWR